MTQDLILENNGVKDSLGAPFISYQINFDGEDFDITPFEARKPSEDIMYFLDKDLEYLRDLDIQNFNFNIFEDDLDKLNDNEFEFFWKRFFLPWLHKIDENYLSIGVEDFQFQLSNSSEKRFLIKKLIHFVMLFLPYIAISKVLEKAGIETLSQARDEFQFYETHDSFLRTSIIESLDYSIEKLNNLIKSLKSFSKITKKGELGYSVDILEDQTRKQQYYTEIFKNIINRTSAEKLNNLVKLYIEKDFINLLR